MTGLPEKYTSGGYASSGDVQTDGYVLYNVSGFNASGSPCYVMFFPHPIAIVDPGDVPVQSFPVAALAEFSWSPSEVGYQFLSGLSWAASSTGDAYTPLAADFWVAAEGRTI